MLSRSFHNFSCAVLWVLFYGIPINNTLAWSTPTATTTTMLRTQSSPRKSQRGKAADRSYDLVVIGGGSAGLTAAKFASGTLKKKCLLIEAHRLGGDCTWTGCVPSKSLLASAKAAQLVRKQAVESSQKTDWKEIQQRFKHIQQEIYDQDDSPEAMSKLGVETMHGMATMVSPTKIQVQVNETASSSSSSSTQIVEATQGIVLCTGAKPKPAASMIPGLDTVDYVTYEQVWDMKEVPQRFTVVGGGPIGSELAQAFSRLGSKVTIIASKLLPQEEPEVGAILQTVFEGEGITVVRDRVKSVAKKQNGKGHIITTSSGQTVEGDRILVSIGRVANVDGLGLEKVGVKFDKGIKVNDKLETTCKGIYAAGDCTGEKQFTHYAGYQGAIAARNILLPLSDPGVLSDVPASTFTSPEVASIGFTEAEARKQLGDGVVGISKMNLDKVDRAMCDGYRHGFLKVLYHKRNGKILGATIMAPAAGELISEIAVARHAGMSFDALAKVIHPYPSYAMALQLMAAEVYYEKTTRKLWLYNFLKRIGL